MTYGCGGFYDATEPGAIMSPSFPEPYPENLDCFYYITADPGFILELYFTFFEIRFFKLVQNLFKVLSVCSVSSSKWPGFERIRHLRENDQHFSQHFFLKFQTIDESFLKIGSKPLQSSFSVFCTFEQMTRF